MFTDGVGRCDFYLGAFFRRRMPPSRKRAAEAAGETAAESKRYRNAIEEMAEEFVCPITQELPVDPVMAQDGRIYEKKAVEDWIASKRGQPLKSPVTNESMGTALLPAVQARNAIRNMVQSGAITGPKADAWTLRIADEETLARLRRQA